MTPSEDKPASLVAKSWVQARIGAGSMAAGVDAPHSKSQPTAEGSSDRRDTIACMGEDSTLLTRSAGPVSNRVDSAHAFLPVDAKAYFPTNAELSGARSRGFSARSTAMAASDEGLGGSCHSPASV